MSRLFIIGFLCTAWALTACGSDGTPVEGSGTGGDFLSGGTLIYSGGTLATTGGTASTGGATATGGTTSTMDGGVFQQPTCDTTVVAATTCGSETCPTPSGAAATYQCTTPCCTDDGNGGQVCGTLSAIEGSVSACMPPPTADPLCPSYTDNMGATVDGCCTMNRNGDSVCGILRMGFGGTTCSTRSGGGFGGGGGNGIQLPATPPPCDGSGLNPGGDAGM